MKVDGMTFRPRPTFGQLFLEDTRFLEHQHVSIQGFNPFVNALSNGRSQAVDVP
jgi:hypothetical protein